VSGRDVVYKGVSDAFSYHTGEAGRGGVAKPNPFKNKTAVLKTYFKHVHSYLMY
jgi:hypothetical protein